MKKYLLHLIVLLMVQQAATQTPFSRYPVYTGRDLGLQYGERESVFRIWSPTATAAQLQLYREGWGGDSYTVVPMESSVQGTWVAKVKGNLKNVFYTVRVQINGQWSDAVTDPYARAAGINGKRALVLDLKDTNPPGWERDISPAFSATNQPTDAIVYEMHIRDATIHSSSGVQHKGTFAGLAELNTRNAAGETTGLSHLKEMGVTHIHLLPFYDYNSVDETQTGQYNWGYDPVNYNVPEGSYSTHAADGLTRIRELKQMIQTFHASGLRVVMDVVYNHTGLLDKSNFNQLVPGYYYRQKADGSFSDATACGNETASERPMFRKFMLESVLYWVKEYHIDGFRFDLMGVHDIETMNLIADTLHKIKPDILLYGEGWTAGESPLPESERAVKKNAHLLKGIAVFSDDIRDGIKGSVFNIADRGFATGKTANTESIKFGVVAACAHPQVHMDAVNYSKAPYAKSPAQVISYCECHDNNILWDKIALSFPEADEATRVRMQQLAYTIVLTAQGISFLHAGSEFLRSKRGEENSYNKGDSINAIDWQLKTIHKPVWRYVQSLIRLRKAHPAFRMRTAEAIARHLRFAENLPAGVVAYTLDGAAVGDAWKQVWVAYNGTATDQWLPMERGGWKAALGQGLQWQEGKVRVPAWGSLILYRE
jgi:pullulanase